MAKAMRTLFAGIVLVSASGLVLTSACSSDDSGGGTSTGGTDAGTGATGGTGGSGGTTGGTGGTATGGTGNTGGCLPAPDPNDVDACDVCQDEQHAYCTCDNAVQACLLDNDCTMIWDCTFDGTDGGVGPCLEFDAASAACVYSCIDLYPNGKALYLAMEKCIYCQTCGQACDTGEYCTALDNQPSSDAGSDASTEAGSDGAADDGAADAAGDAATD